jgi:hypothetical protein
MAADLQHTLTNLEVTPPAGAWNVIASRLDTEFDTTEIKVSEKIIDFELAPPADAWANIEAAIVANPEEVESAPAIYVRKPFRARAAAAAAVLVIALGGWYFLNNKTITENAVSVVPQKKTEERKTVPEIKVTVPEAASVTAQVDDRPLPRRRSGTLIAAASRANVSQASFAFNESDRMDMPAPDDIPHAGLPHIRAINSAVTPNVEAPLIRDADGNLILDKELIFSADNNYIVVTGPNGEQTRISSKFLPLLSSLNGGMESMDYFQFFLNENNIWKLRFNEWRDRVLHQASFIPTATNLLDLLELKEILQEN